MKLDSSRQAGTGVALNGLNGNGGHEVQGVAISLGAGHGWPARMREGEQANRPLVHHVPVRVTKAGYKTHMSCGHNKQ